VREDTERIAAVSDLVEQYDVAALDHLLAEASFREAGIQDLFDRWKIAPHSVFYEDLVADHERTVRGVLAFLELPAPMTIPAPAFAPVADEVSERWYQRFLAERSHLR
jgi:LPS sulfotransferase NodH